MSLGYGLRIKKKSSGISDVARLLTFGHSARDTNRRRWRRLIRRSAWGWLELI
jgi:hypothetical protein